MKQLFYVLLVLGLLLVAPQAQGSDNAGFAEAGQLTAEEAVTLSNLWELEKYVRDVYILGADCSDNPEFVSGAILEQDHMDMLKGLLSHYGLEVPVPGEEVGVLTESFSSAMEWTEWTGHETVCLNPDGSVLSNAFIHEEMTIFYFLQAADQTENQRLLDAYDVLLLDSCARLRRLSLHAYDHPLYLNQDEFDEILAGTFQSPINPNFTINAGLNDAWYFPETVGQGFFISVYEEKGMVFMSWLTYDTELLDEDVSANLGDASQRWLTAQGSYFGNQADLLVYSSAGGLFDSSSPIPATEPIGAITLQFDDCNTGNVTYDLPSIGRSDSIPIQRVTLDNMAACEVRSDEGH